MAVYEHTYKPYEGAVTPTWSRFLIIPRHAYRMVFQSKLFIAFFAACFIFPIVCAILIYLHHNAEAIAILKVAVRDMIPINGSFFEFYTVFQGFTGFALTLLVGPPLISRDTSNNALPLYLCRPFSRAEYVLGKMSVLLILLSIITWIPGLLLFLFQAYLEGGSWLWDNLWIAGSVYFGCWVWMVLISLLALALSAWVKWRMAASGALLAVFFIPSALGEIINQIFVTRWGSIISLGALMKAAWSGLFGTFTRETGQFAGIQNGRPVILSLLEPPLWCSWLALFAFCCFSLWLLYTKVRAYEVVK